MINSNSQEDVKQDVRCLTVMVCLWPKQEYVQTAQNRHLPPPSALCCPVGQREGINVGSLSWALLGAQQCTGGWCSSQRLSLALHWVCKLKGKRLPAPVSCREQREREGASSSPAVASVSFLSQDVSPHPPYEELSERARSQFKVGLWDCYQNHFNLSCRAILCILSYCILLFFM